MSTIMKKPLIETIMDNLDGDTLVKLHSDIDSDTGYSEYNLLERYLPQLGEGEQSLAVRATLITNGETLVGSYIKYSSLGETHSYLLNYGRGVHKVYIYEINEEKKTTYLVGECLGVSELRRVIVDRLIEQGANDIPIHKNENGSYVFNEGLEVKSNGDVTIGKNLEVDGTTKFNGGLKPIHTYSFHDQDGDYILDVWLEKQYGWNEYNFIGTILINGGTPHLIHGDYVLDEGKIQYLTAFAVFSYDEGALGAIHYGGENADMLHKTRFVLDGKAQEKLYTHTLTLTADKSYTLIYPSTSNLKVDSVADLRTIMKVSSTNDNVILPLCATDLTGTAVLQVTTALCKIGTANVTAVTDNVTL